MLPKDDDQRKRALKALPAVDAMLASESGRVLAKKIRRDILTALAREAVEAARQEVLSRKNVPADEQQIIRRVFALFETKCRQLLEPSLRKVINCTGVILHTGLGRAVISTEAAKHTTALLSDYMNLELDLESGKRGDRTKHVEALICKLTEAEAACVVNNNAAAVLIALNSLANRKEVVISRGELVEIGGSFRIPDVMKKSGAKMVEVGTTNKTHRRDFVDAISPRTAGFLHVHTSNYRVQGFTAQVALEELAAIAHANGLFVLHDLGGGILTDLRAFDLPHEPVVRESVAAGADVITFSGDKVLGGPQCGIIVGKKNLIAKIKRNPLMRALRCDKLTYLVLENTLRLFLQPANLQSRHTVLSMFTQPAEQVRQRAEALLAAISPCDPDYALAIVATSASAGSGALPLEKIPSFALALRSKKGTIAALAKRFRLSRPAVLGYTQKETHYLDMRTVQTGDMPELQAVLQSILQKNDA